MMQSAKLILGICLNACLSAPFYSVAEPATDPSGSSVAANIHAMDRDHDGMVTVHEIRSFIEARHGKHYKKVTLDNMEASAGGSSCTSSFAKPLY
jgi:hypothetical protein